MFPVINSLPSPKGVFYLHTYLMTMISWLYEHTRAS